MSNKMNIARTLLVITVMVASAILPAMPEAAELRETEKASRTVAIISATTLEILEGDCGWYTVTPDEAPDGLLVVTASADSALVEIEPAYLKFSKLNWAWAQGFEVCVDLDDDGANLSSTISHALSGTATTASWGSVASISLNGVDIDIDTDGDGINDELDDDDDGDGITDDAEEAGCDLLADCDGDGTNDDSDDFVLDSSETTDTDGDGVGDNADEFDNDSTEWSDMDGDNVGDNSDAFPNDLNEWNDTDGDGVGDNADDFPNDANETTDSDNDTVGDNSDAFPNDPLESADSDGDGVGDVADDFPNDPLETTDSDNDTVGDNSDAFPNDLNESTDSDGDGVGDNADTDDDDDGVADASENTGCELDPDCDGDGYNDSADDFPLDANASTDTDDDGLADDIMVTGAVYDFDFEDGALPTAVTWELSQCTGSDSSCVAGTSAGDWEVSDDTPIDGTYSLRSGELSTNYENTNISLTFTSAAGAMTFDYQISSLCRDYVSTYYDGFRLYVDGVQVDNPSDGGTACENGVWGGVGTESWDTSHPAYSATHFMCADGSQGFSISYVPSWLSDGWTDCSDASDEDASYYAGLLYTPPVSGSHSEDLTAGTHTVTFQFHGGTSGAAGESIAWIDNLVIPVAAGTAGSVGPTTTTDGTGVDYDDDNDGYLDVDETTNCASTSDPLNVSDTPANDNDADYLCDAVDEDDDNDGVLDVNEADGSGTGTNGTDVDCTMTSDCDGDGYADDVDTHPTDSTEWSDMDGDGIGDNSDTDRDGDGYGNSNDEFPDDPTEFNDHDGDGIGDVADADDDTCASASPCDNYAGMGNDINDFYPGDGVEDANDAFPLNPADAYNTDADNWGNNIDYDDDGDGVSDNVDDDDDNDGYSDADEGTPAFGNLSAVQGNCGSGDSGDASVTPDDMDGDFICDTLDDDRDGDGTNNTDDAFPDDACADLDTDGDGMPDDLLSSCAAGDTTLVADDDDDYNSGNAPTVDFVVSVADCDSYDYYDGEGYVLIDGATYYNALYDYDCYLASSAGDWVIGTFTVASGGSLEVEAWDQYSDGSLQAFVQVNGVTVCGPLEDYYGYYDTTCTVYASDYISSVDWTDAEEDACGTDSADSSDEPADMDGDGICDVQDSDIDGDDFSNDDETMNCATSSDANDSTSTPADMDGDLICDSLDDDQDGDGVADSLDDFPSDATETTDTDGDGTGDNADIDDDNDTVNDTEDDFPLDSTEDTDTDNDGIGDNADTDDDGDGWSDADEAACSGGDATNGSVIPDDTDSDGVCDTSDDDDDDDGVLDANEGDGTGIGANSADVDCTLTADCDGDGLDDLEEGATCSITIDCDGDGANDTDDDFPEDSAETTDTDGDGIGNNADLDDDDDGYSDADEVTNCGEGNDPLDSSDTPTDTDGDYECDAVDFDDDADGLPDQYDGCPLDATGFTDNDGDGVCDESDTDDDQDGTPDTEDCAPLDGSMWDDWDGDGLCDDVDADDDGDGIDDAVDGDNGSLAYDFDNDGWDDVEEAACGHNTSDSSDVPSDNDDDGTCDPVDADDDNDGVDDTSDDFPFDSDAAVDTDGDGLADYFLDSATGTSTTWNISTQSNNVLIIHVFDLNTGDMLCEVDGASVLYTNAGGITTAGTDTANATAFCQVTAGEISVSAWYTDYYTYYGAYFGMWAPNVVVDIDGGDGSGSTSYDAQYAWYYDNYFGMYHLLGTFSTANAYGTVLDYDDDNDGYSDAHEDGDCIGDGGYSLDVNTMPADNDGDGLCDFLDDDDDDDGYSDAHEAACGETTSTDGIAPTDTDGDGVCDEVDTDDDDDGTDDSDDVFPLDASEDTDTDSDGTGDNADEDADGDGVLDIDDPAPTDRCSTSDLDGDGLADDYVECSTLGFRSTLNKGEGGNAGLGAEDGDYIGITTADGYYGDVFSGDEADNQWFEVSDTDGVFRIYFDPADDVAWVNFDYAISSTSWEAADYVAAYWIDDSGTHLMGNLRDENGGDMDNCNCEGYWDTASWFLPMEGVSSDGQLMIEFSSTFTSEILGLDNVEYLDADFESIAKTGFEDPVENLGGFFTAPAVPTEYDTTHPAYSATHFMCADGSQGFSMSLVPSWLSDGWQDCADSSDEDETYWAGLVIPTEDLELLNWGSTVTLDVSSHHTGALDDDDDDDGVLDDDDAFPMDGSESEDLDGDNVGDNSDGDVDGDGVGNSDDAFPRHPHADTDTDGDGMPDEIHDYTGEITEDWSITNLTSMDWTQADDSANTGWSAANVAGVRWYVDSSEGAAIANPLIDHGNSMDLEITLATGAGMVSFDWAASSEAGFDWFTFSVDGVSELEVSGQSHNGLFNCEAEGAYHSAHLLDWHYIPGDWVNDGVDDCGDSDQNGIADDEEVSDWYAPHEGNFEIWVSEGVHTFTWSYSKDNDTDGGLDTAHVYEVTFPYVMYGDVGECPSDDTADLCNIEDDNDDNDALDDASDPCPTQGDETIDTDGDEICDNQDTDDDDDGVYDFNDPFPLDATEWSDNDGDGIGDNGDTDDDTCASIDICDMDAVFSIGAVDYYYFPGDGVTDDVDTHPNDPSEWADADGDGWGDNSDPDDDNDGYMDEDDLWPNDQSKAVDTDGDGIPDFIYVVSPGASFDFESGTIANGSGWNNSISNFPWAITTDAISGNYSIESTNVGVQSSVSAIDLSFFSSAGDMTFSHITSSEFQSSCVWDGLRVLLNGMTVWSACGEESGVVSIPITAGTHTVTFEFYKDFIIDGGLDKAWLDNINLPDTLTEVQADTDDDNDGVSDDEDIAPLDACISSDFDGDGLADDVGDGCDFEADPDDDNDGWLDTAEESCGTSWLDSNDTPMDMDMDMVCDNLDNDLDNDGYLNLVTDCFEPGSGFDPGYCALDVFNFMDWDNDAEISNDEAYVFYVIGLGDTEEEFNATVANALNFDYDGNGMLGWGEFWALNVVSGQLPWDATQPDWSPESNMWDMFPFDPSEFNDLDMDGQGDNSDPDDDGDGFNDLNDSFPLNPSEWLDTDGDCGTVVGVDADGNNITDPIPLEDQTPTTGNGCGDNSDDDIDGDGIDNTNDQFDTDAGASTDTDNDGADDSTDNDDDNDGVPDSTDLFPLNPSEWADNDGDCGTILPEDQTATSGDGCGDGDDTDDDNDGVIDTLDAFQYDALESVDSDGDGIGDNSDTDRDGDGYPNDLDAFPDDGNEWRDTDGDTVGDFADLDDDGDEVLDGDDDFPLNPTESSDIDGDGIGDNTDTDKDGDGVDNSLDDFPDDGCAYLDTDGDGMPDSIADQCATGTSTLTEDTDDDGDGYSDADEADCGTSSQSATWTPSDFDGDGLCDAKDTTDSRSDAQKELNAQTDPGFTPGFPSLIAVVSLMGAALMGRRKED